MIYDIGRVCVKIAGRDAGKKCVIVEQIDNTYVLIDGQTRRRKCNVAHLEPTQQSLDIKKSVDHAAIIKAFDAIGVQVSETSKPKKTPARTKKAHQQNKKK